MPYLMTPGYTQGPAFEDDPFWQEEWGSEYQTLIPYFEGKALDAKYFAKSGYLKNRVKHFPPLLGMPAWFCTEDVKAVIETLEPGIHNFYPYEVRRSKTSEEVVARYNWINFCQPLDTLDIERCDPELVRYVKGRPAELGDRYTIDTLYLRMLVDHGKVASLALKQNCIAGRHLWAETKIGGSNNIFVSDEMREALTPFCERDYINFFKTI